MKKVLGVFAFLFVIQTTGWSQEFDEVINHVGQAPKEAEESIESLSQYLTSPFVDEKEKFASIYVWVTHNIQYDIKQYRIKKLFDAPEYTMPGMKIREVWEKRKGVCEHYALIFQELSQKAGLQSAVVFGYTIHGGRVADEGHAWNAIMVDSAWFLVDATWGSGYVEGSSFYPVFKPEFFMMQPKESIQSHMPIDPLWQLLAEPVSYPEFDSQSNRKVKEGLNDPVELKSILFSTDEIEQTTKLIERIKKNGRPGKVVANYLKYEENKLEILKTNRERQLFNKGIHCYNESIRFFNKYANSYNRKFRNPVLADLEIVGLIDSADTKMLEAINFFNEPYQDGKINQLAKDQQQEAIAFHKSITDQSVFVNKYVKTRRIFRPFLFMQFSAF